MLHCPSCTGDLRLLVETNVEIDVCDSCESVWLDPGELNQITPPDRCALGDPVVTSSQRADLCCPHCKVIDFCDITFSQVAVSRCNGCGGVFVGVDELDAIQSGHHDWADRSGESESPDDEKSDRESSAVTDAVYGGIAGDAVGCFLELIVSAVLHV